MKMPFFPDGSGPASNPLLRAGGIQTILSECCQQVHPWFTESFSFGAMERQITGMVNKTIGQADVQETDN